MVVKRDKLGRRIPQFDRSAAGRKSAQTRKENHGTDNHARAGTVGGRARTRGYFGTLKDQGKTAELKAISSEAVKRSNEVQAERGWATRKKSKRSRTKVRKTSK